MTGSKIGLRPEFMNANRIGRAVRTWFLPLVAIFLGAAGSSIAQEPRIMISDVQLGFQRAVKPGFWIPIRVDVNTAFTKFQGMIELTTPDNDEVSSTLIIPNVLAASGERTSVSHFIKLGTSSFDIQVRLIDESGRVVAERHIDQADPTVLAEPLDPQAMLVLMIGQPGGLADAVDRANAPQSTLFRDVVVKPVGNPDLPTQWFAYEGVDVMAVSTRDPAAFASIDPSRASAIRSWVRQGGKLVLSVANNWQIVAQGPWGELLPATLTGLGRVRVPDTLESFPDQAGERLRVGEQGLPVATVENVKGRVVIEAEGKPLVISGNYGLGNVTLLTFDADMAPFSTWQGRTGFWRKLLKLRDQGDQKADTPQVGRLRSYGTTDLASHLQSHIEDFPDVKVVSFGWVAALIFVYILLIGPIDYLILKRFVGRLELTWVTFPAWVILVSACAYFAAHWLKGDQLRIKRVEIVDVDAASETLRGTSCFAVFSPQVDRYSVAMTPQLGEGGNWADLDAGRRDQIDHIGSWLGLPEMGFRGMYRQGGTGLLGRRRYHYAPGYPTAMIDVPIHIWAVKTFVNRWVAKSAPVVEANLKLGPSGLAGQITNKLDIPLKGAFLAYGDEVFEFDEIPAGGVATLPGKGRQSLANFLNLGRLGQAEQIYFNNAERPTSDLTTVIRGLLFWRRTNRTNTDINSTYLRDLDLSEHLDNGRAVLLAQAPGAEGGKLWLNSLPDHQTEPSPIPGVMISNTFIRVLLTPERDRRP